jgi:beta-lactamase regulating signal transducer with metallopeptidase domain/HEAT repeat protein
MTHFLDTVVEPALWFVADWSLRWAALIGLAALVLLALRPRRAATRQLIYLAALVGGLLLPVVPRWGNGLYSRTGEIALLSPERFPQRPLPEIPIQTSLSGGRKPPESALGGLTPPAQELEIAASDDPDATAEPWGNRRVVLAGVAALWGIGVLEMLLRWTAGAWLLRRLRRGAVEVSGPAAEVFSSCRLELGAGSRVRLAAHPGVRSPVLLGLFRPIILVPIDWPALPVTVQRAGLLHELAHVLRRDHWLTPLVQLIRVGFFFHPLVRWLLARMERERELLCDEIVLHRGIDRRDYARMLLDFARQSGRFALPRLSGPYLPIGRRRTIKARIHHLLEENMERSMGPLPTRWAVALGACVLAIMLGVASYRVLAEEGEQSNTAVEQEKPAPADEKNRAETEKVSAARLKREELRYGGKDFNQWRRDLLTELKGSIRVDGMKAFAAFGTNGYGPEATEAVLEIIGGHEVRGDRQSDDDGAVVMAGYNAVRKIGAEALPGLAQGVEGKNRNVRLFAIEALALMKSDARPAVPVLLKAMKNEDVVTRQWALEAVRRIDSRAKGFVPALIEVLKDEDADLRSLAAARLREVSIVKDAKSAVPALLEALRDRKFEVRYNAIETLNSIGAEKQGVLAVSRLLQDDNYGIQTEAYRFLQSLGPDAKAAVPALIAALKRNPDAWPTPIETLAKIGPAAKEAVPALTQAALSTDNPELNKAVMDALKKIGR